jgi:hypothetical protein
MRRALAIDERSFGADHPKVATRLNNLGQLLKASNRLGEAEPPMRRGLQILAEFQRLTGHEHPNLRAGRANYAGLLTAMGKTPDEIAQRLQELDRSSGSREP